jgi:hypothetical protein
MTTNIEIADVLKKARSQMRRTKEEYICVALGDLKLPYSSAAVKMIEARLAPSFAFDGWLHRMGVLKDATKGQIREHRMKWLNMLINEHETPQGLVKTHLLMFLQEWDAWAEAGALDNTFDKRVGLCTSLRHWLGDFRENGEHKKEIQTLLTNDFGSPGAYPFGVGAYYHARREGTIHLDPNRRAWVKAKIQELLDDLTSHKGG